MRRNDRLQGSLRMLLISGLLAGNIVAVLVHPDTGSSTAPKKVTAPQAIAPPVMENSSSRLALGNRLARAVISAAHYP